MAHPGGKRVRPDVRAAGRVLRPPALLRPGPARGLGQVASERPDRDIAAPPDADPAAPLSPEALPWWRRGALYEIYVRSFQDSDGDGIGDLEGIRRRLDHLAWLGVEGIWLTPFYRSPMADFGYDISDYRDVDPIFGDLADFNALVADAHERGIRVVVDFVPNHTSDQHPWFVAARASRDDAHRAWYVWRDDGPDGSPPNNWLSLFGGPAWTHDERTGQSYLHTFLPEQPDLDWRNPEVRDAMFDVARFWLARGVDGFRIDVAGAVMKDPELRDNPPSDDPDRPSPFGADWARWRHDHQFGHPDVYDVWREFRELVDRTAGDRDPVTIAEVSSDDLPSWAAYYGTHLDGVHMPFGFHLLHVAWSAAAVREVVERVEAALPPGAWPNWVLGNHDQPRIASRAGPERARVAMLLLLTLRGAPTLYYGDELGMPDGRIPPGHIRDPWEARVPGLGRDPARTPMRWEPGPGGGFCPPDVEPWLPLDDGTGGLDVATQRADPRSMLHLTRDILALRRSTPALAEGAYRSVDGPPGCYVYERSFAGGSVIVALDLEGSGATVDLSGPGRILLATHRDRSDEPVDGCVELAPFEGVVVELTAARRAGS